VAFEEEPAEFSKVEEADHGGWLASGTYQIGWSGFVCVSENIELE